ncbi:MAG: flagellar M-ring protein FliF [Zoogloeaceae bacterium]|jgi:flagellar M-ring protein FliF|nr:flagellar M-ring protein FliF [Zoogloeaceae bacterium]
MAANPDLLADSATPAADPPVSPPAAPLARLQEAFARLDNRQKLTLAVALAAIVSLIVAVYLWSREPAYKVLFANFSERDGGAIIAALEQANVPYRHSEGGGAILVPSERVHEVRLRLASQGLPRGGSIGFELMENQTFGTSQFIEQMNYQRALEGELARTIESIASVQSARVHLAIPKPSVFVREAQKPTASVLIHLFPGRFLEPEQVAGIGHLVASSVPQLPLANVNIIDQGGNLLSRLEDPLREKGLDPKQLNYVHEVEEGIVKRIREILRPVLGEGNFQVQVAADLDFSHTEQTAEIYQPNGNPTDAAIRSRQTLETANLDKPPPGGVPGALTNQPPVPATAPITQPPVPPADATAAGQQPPPPANADRGRVEAAGIDSPLNPVSPPLATRKETTTNYEVGKTIRYTRQSLGSVRRLTAAVVVNHRMEMNTRAGKEVPVSRSEEEITQITNLVRDAMGYNAERGDSVSVASAPFAALPPEEAGPPPWKDPANIPLGLALLKYLGIAAILAYLFLGVIRPILKTMFPPPAPPETKEEGDAGEAGEGASGSASSGAPGSEEAEEAGAADDPFMAKLRKAKEIAQEDPKIVANIIKDWMGANG